MNAKSKEIVNMELAKTRMEVTIVNATQDGLERNVIQVSNMLYSLMYDITL